MFSVPVPYITNSRIKTYLNLCPVGRNNEEKKELNPSLETKKFEKSQRAGYSTID